MSSLVNIGLQKETVKEVRGVLLDILSVDKCGDTAKVAACEALSKLVKVDNVHINNCVFKRGR